MVEESRLPLGVSPSALFEHLGLLRACNKLRAVVVWQRRAGEGKEERMECLGGPSDRSGPEG